MKATIDSLNLDIVIANESWFDSTVPLNFLDNFEVHKRGRSSRGGGVFLALKNNLKSIRKTDFECELLENVCIKLQLKNLKILILTI